MPQNSSNLALLSRDVVPYRRALELQLSIREALTNRNEPRSHHGAIISLQHEPVITIGKRGSTEELPPDDWLEEHDVDTVQIERGGKLTYHGPGQLVIYPILDLRQLDFGVVDVVRGLAEAVQDVLLEFGISTEYDTENPGLWLDDSWPPSKIASVGMRVENDITTHGIAVNVTNDLSPFSAFVPCGLPESSMTRLSDHLDENLNFEKFEKKVLSACKSQFGWQLEEASVENLLGSWQS